MSAKEITWNHNLAYAIGLITTDGNLSKDGRHIVLVSKDIDQLKNLARCLELKSKISAHSSSFNPGGKYYHLAFSNAKLYRFLVNIGLTPNKSLTLGPLDIEKRFFGDFLRGVIDGDGNISTWIHNGNQNRQWCLRIFSASNSFIMWLNNKIEEYFRIKGNVYSFTKRGRKYPTYTLKYGMKSAIRLLQKVGNNNGYALSRKAVLINQLCLHTSSNLVN